MNDGIDFKNNVHNPGPNWFHDKSWKEICHLDELIAYHGNYRIE